MTRAEVFWAVAAAALVAAGLLSYRSGSRPRLLSAAHTIRAVPPERASLVIVAPATLPRFFAGVRNVEADPSWPEVGSSMTWRIGPGGSMTFRARVVDNDLPRSLRMHVVTPSSDSVITQRFEADGGGTRYEKRVELHYRGFLNQLLGPLLTLVIARSLPGEVARAAAAAADP
jgi:hypothetical protein